MRRILPSVRGGRLLAVGLLGVVLAGVWFAVAAPLIFWHAERALALKRQAARVRRMQALADALPSLRAAAAAPNAAAPGLLSGASDAIAEADLQQRLQQITADAGAALSSTEALEAAPAGGDRRVGLAVSASADWPELVAMLQAIEQARPRMLVDDLEIHATGAITGSADPPLAVSFTLYGFRAAGAVP